MNVYIRTDEWLPWENTIAYYPLKTDFNDAKTSWTKYNLTNSWVTLSELWWVTCANFNWSNSKATGSFYSYWTWDLTASVRWYPLSNNQWVWWCIWLTTLVMNSKNWVVEWTSAPTPINTWTNIVFTITWGKLKIYSNGTLYLDTSFSNNVTWDLMLWIDGSYRYWFYWWVSELIFENRAWTADQIAWYYNQTKSLYWLS